MHDLFNRDVRLTVGDLLIKSRSEDNSRYDIVNTLRVSFSANMSTSRSPNTCEIRIYNLSQNKRKMIGKGLVSDQEIKLQAGYLNSINTIFKGRSSAIRHHKENVDWITTIECIDGIDTSKSVRFTQSFNKGVKLIDIVETISLKINEESPNLNTFNMLRKLREEVPPRVGFQDIKKGMSINGNIMESLFNILNSAGWEASIQNSTITVTRKNEGISSVVELNADSGLIGSVEEDRGGFVTGKSLLNGEIYPYRVVNLKSVPDHKGEFLFSGLYRVNRSQHYGDTWGNDWYTNFDLISAGS